MLDVPPQLRQHLHRNYFMKVQAGGVKSLYIHALYMYRYKTFFAKIILIGMHSLLKLKKSYLHFNISNHIS